MRARRERRASATRERSGRRGRHHEGISHRHRGHGCYQRDHHRCELHRSSVSRSLCVRPVSDGLCVRACDRPISCGGTVHETHDVEVPLPLGLFRWTLDFICVHVFGFTTSAAPSGFPLGFLPPRSAAPISWRRLSRAPLELLYGLAATQCAIRLPSGRVRQKLSIVLCPGFVADSVASKPDQKRTLLWV